MFKCREVGTTRPGLTLPAGKQVGAALASGEAARDGDLPHCGFQSLLRYLYFGVLIRLVVKLGKNKSLFMSTEVNNYSMLSYVS